jgi:putative transcriptional regulator
MASLQGQLLVASPQMRDPNFHRSIILIVKDDGDGAMGVILNRPLEISIKDACERVLETPCAMEGYLHQGGPCDGPMMVLYEGDAFGSAAGDVEVFAGVWFITNKDEIEQLLAEGPQQLKCIIGYAGWGSEQLANEMTEGAWLVSPVSAERVFSGDPKQWSKLMTQLTMGDQIDPRRIPDDPSVN